MDERMNWAIKEATVKRYHYETHDQLRQHLTDFVAAYNFARRLKTLRGLTPYEAICKAWTDDPTGSSQTRTTNRRGQTSKLRIQMKKAWQNKVRCVYKLRY
jgi:hypothetical protein